MLFCTFIVAEKLKRGKYDFFAKCKRKKRRKHRDIISMIYDTPIRDGINRKFNSQNIKELIVYIQLKINKIIKYIAVRDEKQYNYK